MMISREKKAIIYIFSEIEDLKFNSLVNTLLKNIHDSAIKPEIRTTSEFFDEEEALYILKINSLENPYCDKILNEVRSDLDRFLFIVPVDNALLATKLIKSGFRNLFVFPQEIYKFDIFIKGLIKKRYAPPSDAALSKDSEMPIIGSSEEIRKLRMILDKIGNNNSVNVLITGESGTGKSLFANEIHRSQSNPDLPFIDINCTSIPENLLESELFGYEKGAFTDAKSSKPGLLEMAAEGTVYFDEIGDIGLHLQAKLLRVIEKKVFRRIGGLKDEQIEARFISSTNRDLDEMVRQGIFRRDLYHRLNVLAIEIPPLRKRKDDIPQLANHFISFYNRRFNKQFPPVDDKLLRLFTDYNWPGNIRELKHAIERAALLSPDDHLEPNFLNLQSSRQAAASQAHFTENSDPNSIFITTDYREASLADMEALYAREVLMKLKGNKSKTAKYLGVSRPKLDKLLQSGS